MAQYQEVETTLEDLKHLFSERALSGETMVLNMGPQHPSTHGVLRLILELDGETVVRAIPDIGFLHTGIEKNMEAKTYLKALVMTDRLDYLNNIGNNLTYCLAIEKLMDVKVPERAQVLRVLMAELQRIASHLVWLGTHCIDLAALSILLYAFRDREKIMDIFEMISGQRMMTSYIRPGGVWRDVPAGFKEAVTEFLDEFPPHLDDYERLLTNNPIFKSRTIGIGTMSAEEARHWGLTGPSLRGSGVNFDVRRAMPYCGYETYEFDVPLETGGDVYARYRCRMREFRESLKIVRQALDRLDKVKGPFITDDRKVAPPPRSELATSMESLIHHFKLWTEGFTPPKGEVYAATESPRGELGVYLVSNGTPKPHRVHYRCPSWANLQALNYMSEGHMVADLVAIIGSTDIVLGDVDR
ncbi:MAG TPA: NADH dehydrogenase (quinone) subunit D [Anaerolineales bacterium]|nr:NADH dehydrogenase (quinone) subunit D [Anaerolineales bacterium]